MHNGREDLVCGHCGVRFGSRKQLYQHVRKLGVEAESVRKVAFNIDWVDKEALSLAAKGGDGKRRTRFFTFARPSLRTE